MWEKIAETYDCNVLSPLIPGVYNPLYEWIRRLEEEYRHTVADVGCGTGRLLPFLGKNFEKVWGIDWSHNMLLIAKARSAIYPNIRLIQMDMRNLAALKTEFDVILSINSILIPDDREIIAILRNIWSSLRINGLLAAIFPSLDAVLHQRDIMISSYVKGENLSRRQATMKADAYFVVKNKLNRVTRMYADDGVHLQRFFTPEDITSFLNANAFSILEFRKLLYPWKLTRKYGYGYFPGQPEIWDWFVIARKTSGRNSLWI